MKLILAALIFLPNLSYAGEAYRICSNQSGEELQINDGKNQGKVA